MAYTPTEWVSGTTISASKLNNIERGVESVNSEYTPTTWAEGDTVTAAKLNKIEQGIADASGGGGELYEVTFELSEGIEWAQVFGFLTWDPESPANCTAWKEINSTDSISDRTFKLVTHNGISPIYARCQDGNCTFEGDNLTGCGVSGSGTIIIYGPSD